MRRLVLLLGVCAACATGKTDHGQVDGGGGGADATVDAARADSAIPDPPGADAAVDASFDASAVDAAVDAAAIDAAFDASTVDASTVDGAVDARPDATPDARPDAMCTTQTVQLLANPHLDDTPVGTGWVDLPTDPTYPLITGDDGIVEDTAPYKIWMAGINDADDVVYQDVAVPAGTTSLTLSGKYAIATAETISGTYDFAYLEVRSTGGSTLETLQTLNDDTVATTWTPMTLPLIGSYAGQTIRIYFHATNDFSDETSFYYDTLALNAQVTVCP
jgi:hypothetical protein